MSVGVGVGLVMLAREGLSFAALKRMEDDEEASAEDVLEELTGGRAGRGRAGRRARRTSHRRVPGAERAEPGRDDGVGGGRGSARAR